MMRPAFLLWMALAGTCAPAQARDSLGVFEQWGAFRDPDGARCYAIAEPLATNGQRPPSAWRAFASVGHWPRRGVRGQFHVRLSRARADASPVTLAVGDRRFTLLAGRNDAWARNRADDAAIIGAMRASRSMSVEGAGRDGRPFADAYSLRGAATAMDAAALGCVR